MIIVNDIECRNLQQQVAKNASDIAELKESGVPTDAYTKEESDAKFQTIAGMSTYATKAEVNGKQDTLVSGTNIKTINGTSVLGSGDIIIGEGGTTVTGGNGIIVNNEGVISIDTSVVAELSDIPTVPTKTSDLNNDSGFITKSVNDLTNYTLSSALSTVATTGSYTDLSNTPTIPSAVSGTNDGTNWTSLTIGEDTYGLASGGGSAVHLYEHYTVLASSSNAFKPFYIYLRYITSSSTAMSSLDDLWTTLRSTPRASGTDCVSCSGFVNYESNTYYQVQYIGLAGTDDPTAYTIKLYYRLNTSGSLSEVTIKSGSTTYGYIYNDTVRQII